jgi:hypothetical protein
MGTSTAIMGVRSSKAQSRKMGACGGHVPKCSHPRKECPELCPEESLRMSAHHSTTRECDSVISYATEQNWCTITSFSLEKAFPPSMV